MPRYEVIESKAWKRDDGRTASLYGAVPWTSSSEEARWKVVTRGYTIRDNVSGTVGVGRKPWETHAEAQAWADKANERVAGVRAHSTKRTSPSDLREFRGFLRNATDRQVQGIYDKEQSAGRDEYAELAVEEAERRGIFLERENHARKKAHVCATSACKKSHAHTKKKKKTPAQLDREIADALSASANPRLARDVQQALQLYTERGEFNPYGRASAHGSPPTPLAQARDVLTRAGHSWSSVAPLARNYIRAVSSPAFAEKFGRSKS